jgi:DNA-3-methyladenine glycosylase II
MPGAGLLKIDRRAPPAMKKAIFHLKKSDPVLGGIIERVGPYKIQYRDPIFQTLVRSIVYQQLHGKAALSIFNRLMAAARTEPLTPEAILRLRPARMRALGLSPQKLNYIRELARMTRAGEVDFEACAALEDEAVVEHLTRVKGIGVWTVHMFLIFALRRPNVLPTGDLGVRAAIKKAYNLADLPKPVEMERLAAAWRPYCSVASWYLWRSLENQGAM